MLVGFAHSTYALADEFVRRRPGVAHFEVRDYAGLQARIAEAEVLTVSGLWDNELLDSAGRLRMIQVVSSGIELFDLERLGARGIRVANGRGVNAQAVAEHAMGMILSMTRQIHWARDHQVRAHWRPLHDCPQQREEEISGKVLAVVGTGEIGRSLARIAKQGFGMQVLGVRRQAAPAEDFDEVYAARDLAACLARADVVVVACPLTDETRGLIDRRALEAMRADAYLVNVGRGAVVDTAALLAALDAGHLAGVGLDCFETEPLPADSPLWRIERVLVTPHAAGETRRYEGRIIDILLKNLARLERGEERLINQII